MGKLYIITAVFNRKDVSVAFAELVSQQAHKDYQLIVVDDGSTDGTKEALNERFPEVDVVRTKGDLWWGGSLQFGLKHLYRHYCPEPSDNVLFINDDTKFDSDYFEKGVELLSEAPGCQLYSICCSLETGEIQDAGVNWDWRYFLLNHPKKGDPIECCSTRGLFLKVETLKKIGGFHPIILPHYLSDYEFTIRGVRKGFPIIVNEELKVFTSQIPSACPERYFGNTKQYFKKLFSIRNGDNPIFIISFILLAAPDFLARVFCIKRVFWEQFRNLKQLIKNAPEYRHVLPFLRWMNDRRAEYSYKKNNKQRLKNGEVE